MRRRSATKKPHNPHCFYLDEGISSPDIARLLRDAGMSVSEYEAFLPRNKSIDDESVINKARAENHILVTKDESLEREWIDTVLATEARLIMLTDSTGGIAHMAAALICSNIAVERTLLDNPKGPLIIKVNHDGSTTKIEGETALRVRWNRLFQARIIRAKRLIEPKPITKQSRTQRRPRAASTSLELFPHG